MKVWLPYTEGGSGSDVSTRFLAQGLQAAGHEAILQAFPHNLQYLPWWLKSAKPPPGTEVIITNTWNGFAFHRPGAVNITVERLFVLDPAYRAYRSFGQAVFHEGLVRHFVSRSVLTAGACVAVSDYSANALASRLGLPKPHVILNAVDTDFFTPAPVDNRLADRRERPFRLLFVGNFTRRKGADVVLEVMKRLGPDYQLQFTSGIRVGQQGSYPSNMRCLGRLSLEEVRTAYRQADALLFPSRLEGLPRTVMESLACGTPVIAADTSSIPEAVDHASTGLLCPINDVGAFTEAIGRLATHSDLWSHMTKAARQQAVKQFALPRMVREYVHIAEQLRSNGTGLHQPCQLR